MQTILSQLLPILNDSSYLDFFNYAEVQAQFYTNPSSYQSWNWNQYFQFLCFQGLENDSSTFQTDFPVGSNQHYLYSEYSELGHENLQFELP